MKNDLLEAIADCLRNEAHIECECDYTIQRKKTDPYISVVTPREWAIHKPLNLVSVHLNRNVVDVYVPRVSDEILFQARHGFPVRRIYADSNTGSKGKDFNSIAIDKSLFGPFLDGSNPSPISSFLVFAALESLPYRDLSELGRAKLLTATKIPRRTRTSTPSLRATNPPKPIHLADTSAAFDHALLDLFNKIQKETNYRTTVPKRFLCPNQGVEVSNKAVGLNEPSPLFLFLFDNHRLDLTIEALVIRPEWKSLFHRDILFTASRRLEQYEDQAQHVIRKMKSSTSLTPVLTPSASDLKEGPALRVQTTTYRILRDTELARRVKELHKSNCQICGKTIQLRDGTNYAEAHHIQPLGEDGPDVIGNIICVCPNHHAELDYRVAPLSLAELKTVPDHAIDPKFVDYHNRAHSITGQG